MTNYYLQELAAASPRGGQVLAVTFRDGFAAEIDLTPWIDRGGLRAPLADPVIFAAVKVNEFGAPEWPDEIDLSPGTLRAWCEAGRVMNTGETDAWINSRPAQDVA